MPNYSPKARKTGSGMSEQAKGVAGQYSVKHIVAKDAGDDQKWVPERRRLQPIADALAAAANIPVAFLKVEQDRVEFLAQGLQNPFIELVYGISAINALALDNIKQAATEILARDNSLDKTCDVKSAGILSDYMIASLEYLPDYDIFILIGPTFKRQKNGRNPLISQRTADHITSALAKYANDHESKGEDAFPIDRANRLIAQRTSLMKSDFEDRCHKVWNAFHILMDIKIDSDNSSADRLEALTKIAGFCAGWLHWAKRKHYHFPLIARDSVTDDQGQISTTDLLETTLRARVEFIKTHDERPGRVFDIEVKKIDQKDAKFEVVRTDQDTAPDGADPFDEKQTSGLIKSWSRFCDNFTTCRGESFFEKMLLIRLWTQEAFSGLTIESDNASKHEALFNKLCKQIRTFLGADGCILYRYSFANEVEAEKPTRRPFGKAIGLGADLTSDLPENFLSLNYKHLDDAHKSSDGRKNSALYRAIDSAKTVFVPKGGTGDAAVLPDPKTETAIISPLKVHGRVWGAIELVGGLDFQLHSMTERWLEEVSRAITPKLYNQWTLYHLHAMSKESLTGIRKAESEEEFEKAAYAKITDHLRQLLVGASARLYRQDESKTRIYRHMAASGTAWPDGIRDEVSLDDAYSPSAACINSEKDWLAWPLSEPKYHKPGDDFFHELIKRGHKQGLVIPIRDDGGQCFCTICLTAVDDAGFEQKEWGAVISTIKKQLGVALEFIHMRAIRATQDDRFLAHALKENLKGLSEGVYKFEAATKPLFDNKDILKSADASLKKIELALQKAGIYRNRSNDEIYELTDAIKRLLKTDEHEIHTPKLTKISKDLQRRADNIITSAQTLSEGKNTISDWNIEPKEWRKQGGTPARIRACLLESFYPRSEKFGPEKISIPSRYSIEPDMTFMMPSIILTEIFNNIFDNAIKYGTPPASLKIDAKNFGDRIEIIITNKGPVVPPEEAEKIKEGRGRATYAIECEEEGAGLGLSYCLKEAEKWQFGFEYSPPLHPIQDEEPNIGHHEIKLTFKV